MGHEPLVAVDAHQLHVWRMRLALDLAQQPGQLHHVAPGTFTVEMGQCGDIAGMDKTHKVIGHVMGHSNAQGVHRARGATQA